MALNHSLHNFREYSSQSISFPLILLKVLVNFLIVSEVLKKAITASLLQILPVLLIKIFIFETALTS